MRLKMLCAISYKLNGEVVASLWINDIHGNEYMKPFCKICKDKKEAFNILRKIMTGKSEHYNCDKMKFERTNHHKLGKDEVFEYIGEVDEVTGFEV